MITVTPPQLRSTPNGTVVEATITTRASSERLWYETSLALEHAYAEPFLLPALLAGMVTNEPVETTAPISGVLLDRLPDIQRILSTWHPSLRPIDVRAPRSLPREPRPTREAAFFSAGVDSFATVLRRRAKLSSLILVCGSEIDLSNTSQWSLVRDRIQRAAGELGLELVTVLSNVRRFAERAGDWTAVTHGVGFASIALLFQDEFSCTSLASSFSLCDLVPWGSHPFLDPLLGTDRMRIEHDGIDLSRPQKIALIATSDVALRHLRVCNVQTGAYNCGKCEKCLRTSVALQLVGALARCETFPYNQVSASDLRNLWLPAGYHATYARENLDTARQVGATDIANALESAIWRLEWREQIGRVRALLEQTTTAHVWNYARRLLWRRTSTRRAG